ncbi:MAG TPA: DUF523 domain-containing protein [Clostridiales bacterium]|nr:DUF523 domain-containing protein [Clostridiales bacterium]
MIIVSACLLGENCKYSGGNNYNEDVIRYLEGKNYLPVCPEIAGGLSSPRPPAEIQNGRVVDKEGKDLTAAFLKGAEVTLSLAKKHAASLCILKANSPSCGCGRIYDGTFRGKRIPGNGKTAALLLQNGFQVVTEEDLKRD